LHGSKSNKFGEYDTDGKRTIPFGAFAQTCFVYVVL
jgi:hypothetical protein